MVKLWIGGSSCLAETYFHSHPEEDWILLGLEKEPPFWMISSQTYVSFDLTKSTPPCSIQNVTEIIVGIRPPLVSHKTKEKMLENNLALAEGLGRFMEHTIRLNQQSLRLIIHLSSVAAVDHTEVQHNQSEADTPVKLNLIYPYDIFKANCEGVVTNLGQKYDVEFTHLRLSALFSNSSKCIQCSALGLQSIVGTYTPHAIDCNSSKNVGHLIDLLLHKRPKNLYSVYYYTRPTQYVIRPYGEYLRDYRKANQYHLYLDLPYPVIALVCWVVHALASILADTLPFLFSIDYLLQVAGREHSFDLSRIRRDFPELTSREETIEECFRRRHKLQKSMNIRTLVNLDGLSVKSKL